MATDDFADTADPRADLLIVGGGPTGHAAARAYREAGGPGRVLLVSADSHPPYNRPPLSKDFLRGESGEDELPLDDADFYADHDIELRLNTEVTAFDVATRTASTADGQQLPFRQVVLATGARPTSLPVPGGETAHRLRFLDQARELKEAAGTAGSAIVVGSGFIGCETAASLAARGLTVTQLSTEELPQIARLGPAAAERIAGWLTDAGVTLVGQAQVAEIRHGREVRLDDGRTFTADLVLTAVGIEPQIAAAADAGLETESGRIVADAHLRTSEPGFLVAGDVAFAENATAGRRLVVEHWGEAERMGEIAGHTAAGQDDAWTDVPGFWSEIGEHTLKYAAWGDGFDEARLDEDADGFTVRYLRAGRLVGVLTSGHDDDYDQAPELIARDARPDA